MRALTLLQVFLVGILLTGILPDARSGTFVCLIILMSGALVVFRELRLPDGSHSRKRQRMALIPPHAHVYPLTAARQIRSGDLACSCSFAPTASPRPKQPARPQEPVVSEAAERANWAEWMLKRADQ